MTNFIKSPLNYTGGKFKLLPQLLPLFPSKIDVFYDLFAGGANVCINVNAKKIYATDINKNVIDLFKYLQNEKVDDVFQNIEEVIKYYGLSNTTENGYDFYGCNSSDGVGSYNKSGFSLLKKDYNNPNDVKWNKNLLFYVLIIFSFNNQIRFNGKGEFNISTGKRDFNNNMRKNLKSFIDKIHSTDITFETSSALDVDVQSGENNFVYIDPPYLISVATYNEADGWNDEKEKSLLKYIKSLNDKGVKFALSNVLEHKGVKNNILINWVEENDFKTNVLDFSYKNSSYQAKSKDALTQEVLITNY